MRTTARKAIVPLAVTSLAWFGLAACGSDDAEPEPTPEETAAAEETDDAAEEVTEEATEDAEAPVGDGAAASWANPVTTEGELIGTIEAGDLTVDVHQVAIDQATRSSIWADPETEEPIVSEGDDVVVLNYVVTNDGDPITLNSALVEIGLRYDDWPYMQQPSVADNDLLAEHGVNADGLSTDALGEDVYVLGTGEQYSVGEVMLYQPGEAYTIQVEAAPRDDAGERQGDSLTGELAGSFE